MNNQIILDSFAMVCLFHKKKGWEKIQQVFYDLSSSEQKAIMNSINWGEFYYIVKKHVGKRKAEETFALLSQLPIKILHLSPATQNWLRKSACVIPIAAGLFSVLGGMPRSVSYLHPATVSQVRLMIH